MTYKVPYTLASGFGGTQYIVVEANASNIAKMIAEGQLPPGAKFIGTATLL